MDTPKCRTQPASMGLARRFHRFLGARRATLTTNKFACGLCMRASFLLFIYSAFARFCRCIKLFLAVFVVLNYVFFSKKQSEFNQINDFSINQTRLCIFTKPLCSKLFFILFSLLVTDCFSLNTPQNVQEESVNYTYCRRK